MPSCPLRASNTRYPYLQALAQIIDDVRVVFYDQDDGRVRHCSSLPAIASHRQLRLQRLAQGLEIRSVASIFASLRTGRRKVKHVPLPTSLCLQSLRPSGTVALWLRLNRSQPLPLPRGERSILAPDKAVENAGELLRGMPVPVSITLTSSQFPGCFRRSL